MLLFNLGLQLTTFFNIDYFPVISLICHLVCYMPAAEGYVFNVLIIFGSQSEIQRFFSVYSDVSGL